MTERELYRYLMTTPLDKLLSNYPFTSDFFENHRMSLPSSSILLGDYLSQIDATVAGDFGLTIDDIPLQLCRFLLSFMPDDAPSQTISSLTIVGGNSKSGVPENVTITMERGTVTAIVGPTGSGKSRLLADIECLAQQDTPTKRQILVNGEPLSDDVRFDMDGKLVAQLSQNMNFIMDLSVREFLEMHARSRFSRDVDSTVDNCLICANQLAGETFAPETKVTQLSGGQSRALMIADTAYMSASPLVLIDEIENAGIDRRQAIRVLTKSDKIVLIATHDPLLALGADRRIVIKNGGISRIIKTTPEEKRLLEDIEKADNTIQSLRGRLRAGELITAL